MIDVLVEQVGLGGDPIAASFSILGCQLAIGVEDARRLGLVFDLLARMEAIAPGASLQIKPLAQMVKVYCGLGDH